MVFVDIHDFYEKAAALPRLTRKEELSLAEKMRAGDKEAKERLVEGYLPFVAAHIRRQNPRLQTLGMALYCIAALEKAVDSFNFFQTGETFAHRLSWALRQASTRYIVK